MANGARKHDTAGQQSVANPGTVCSAFGTICVQDSRPEKYFVFPIALHSFTSSYPRSRYVWQAIISFPTSLSCKSLKTNLRLIGSLTAPANSRPFSHTLNSVLKHLWLAHITSSLSPRSLSNNLHEMSHSHGISSSPSSPSNEEIIMMIPYFHFTGGDNLFFSAWRPSSAGAISGACVGVFFMAILERFLAAIRAACEARWHQRALALMAARSDDKPSCSRTTDDKSDDLKGEVAKKAREGQSLSPLGYERRMHIQRTIFPFIPAHDIPRGVLHSVQALFGYLLMLAVMTFNVSYIISIIIGLGVGEILFGRVGGLGGRMTGGH